MQQYKMTHGYIKPGKAIEDCRNCAKAEKCPDFPQRECDHWEYQKIEIEYEILHCENALRKYEQN